MSEDQILEMQELLDNAEYLLEISHLNDLFPEISFQEYWKLRNDFRKRLEKLKEEVVG